MPAASVLVGLSATLRLRSGHLALWGLMAVNLLALPTAARADQGNIILGSGLGAVAGAIIGHSVGGRDGAIVGGAIGGAVGASAASDGYRTGPPPPRYPTHPTYLAHPSYGPPAHYVYEPVRYVRPVHYVPPLVYHAPYRVYGDRWSHHPGPRDGRGRYDRGHWRDQNHGRDQHRGHPRGHDGWRD